MSYQQQIEEAFPEIGEIEDSRLRKKVTKIWVSSLEDSEFDDINQIPWSPRHEDRVGHRSQVPHVRDVIIHSITLTDNIIRRNPDIKLNRDQVIAGAVLHDISKLYETDQNGYSELSSWIPHPHYCVAVLAEHRCSDKLHNIVLAHTDKTYVEPQSLEAEIVKVADELAVSSMMWNLTGELGV